MTTNWDNSWQIVYHVEGHKGNKIQNKIIQNIKLKYTKTKRQKTIKQNHKHKKKHENKKKHEKTLNTKQH